MNAIMLPLLPLRILIMVIGLAAWAILARVAVIGLDLRQDEDVFLTGWRFRVSQLSGAPRPQIAIKTDEKRRSAPEVLLKHMKK